MADEQATDQQVNTDTVASEEGVDTSAQGQETTNEDTLLGQQGSQDTSSEGDGSTQQIDDEAGTDTTSTADGDATDDSEGEGQNLEIDYEALEVPEGYEVNFDEYKDRFKELGLNQEQVQAILEMGAEQSQKNFDADQTIYDQVQDDLQKASREDAEIGGQQFDANLATAKKALDAFGSPELMEYLRITGAGNHPEVIRAFVRVGKAISEDGLVSPDGGYGAGAPKSREEVMYPGMGKDAD